MTSIGHERSISEVGLLQRIKVVCYSVGFDLDSIFVNIPSGLSNCIFKSKNVLPLFSLPFFDTMCTPIRMGHHAFYLFLIFSAYPGYTDAKADICFL